TYQGNKHLKQEDLDELSQVRVGAPLSPITNRYACQRIVARLNEQGRPFASCTLIKGGEPGDNEVIFSITEGPKVFISDINLTGHPLVSGPVLATHIAPSHRWFHLFGGTYNQAMVEADVNELEKYYRSFGYHDVKISRELEWLGPESANLIFHVHE